MPIISYGFCFRCMSRLSERDTCPHCGVPQAAMRNEPHQLPCGSVLSGKYLVGRVLGQGGFGITYIGMDTTLRLKVAVKEYFPQGCVSRDPDTGTTVLTQRGDNGTRFLDGLERFLSEAQTLAQFADEPHIVNVRDFFSENGTAYIIMDFVEGRTIKSLAQGSGGRLPAEEVLALLRPLLPALALVHDAGLLHRDISPDNIMIDANRQAVLIDFGAARMISAQGEYSNTINVKHGYAPEEQYRTHGQQAPWTDVYAFCATLYKLATGQTPPQAMDRLASKEPLTPPNALGAAFTEVQQAAVMAGLSIYGRDRPRDMRELEGALFGEIAFTPRTAAYGEACESGETTVALQGDGTRKRKKRALSIAAVAAALALAGITLFFLLNERGKENAQVGATMLAPPISQPAERTPAPASNVPDTPEPASAQTLGPESTPTPKPVPDTRILWNYEFLIDTYGNDAVIMSYKGYWEDAWLDADYIDDAVKLVVPYEMGEYRVSAIERHAFYRCAQPRLVTISPGIERIKEEAFRATAFESISIPASVSFIGEGAFAECSALETLSVAEDNPYYELKDGMLLSADGMLLLDSERGAGEMREVPAGVTRIANWAFRDRGRAKASEPRKLVLPEGLESIGAYAFQNWENLAEIHIPASVREIGTGAFDGCTSLAMLTVSEDNPVFAASGNAFTGEGGSVLLACLQRSAAGAPDEWPLFAVPEGVRSIAEQACTGCALREVVLPDGIEEIGKRAFYKCTYLKSITIPASVTSIAEDAFEGCYQGLTIFAPDGSYAQQFAQATGMRWQPDAEGAA